MRLRRDDGSQGQSNRTDLQGFTKGKIKVSCCYGVVLVELIMTEDKHVIIRNCIDGRAED